MVKSAAKQHRIELSEALVDKLEKDVPEILALFSTLDKYTINTSNVVQSIDPSELRQDKVEISDFDAFSNTLPRLVEKNYFVTTRIKKQG